MFNWVWFSRVNWGWKAYRFYSHVGSFHLGLSTHLASCVFVVGKHVDLEDLHDVKYRIGCNRVWSEIREIAFFGSEKG